MARRRCRGPWGWRSQRLNPRKTDLHRWRETLAEKLRGWGIEAEATRQATRGALRNAVPTWQIRAYDENRLRRGSLRDEVQRKTGDGHVYAIEAWGEIIQGLPRSGEAGDRELAEEVSRYVRSTPFADKTLQRQKQRAEREPERTQMRTPERARPAPAVTRTLPDRDIER